MERILGIDLGTTNSVVAVVENGKPVVIQNKRGERLTPSVVAFDKNGECLVGRAAKNQAVVNSDRTISSIKRKMGSQNVIEIGNREYSPQEISAKILMKLKDDAEEFFGEKIDKAVITVPAYFNDNQRQATKEAGKIAGFDVMRIINEPTAAALAYGVKQSSHETILIFDLGGGTFDVSILEIGEGVFEVLTTSGNNKLGGDDFDERLMELIIKRYKESENIDLSQDNMALQKLREEVEKAKVELSFSDRAELNIPFISADETGPKHLNMEIYKNDFEDLIEEFVEETISLTTKTLKDANLTAEDIDKVILVGGSTRVPFIQKEVEKVLGKDITKGVNPDECVALGAAIQASILSGETHDMVLVDVTPLSLGIEIEGGVFVPVIERNTTIPVTASKLFTTITDFQKSVEIHVYQGERLRCQDNVSLGQCHLTGIRRAKKGEPRIEVVFSLDVDGILNVSARDLDTGNIQKVKITNTTSLSQDKIAKLIDEAQKHKQKDVENIKSEGIKSQFIAQYNLFKELYDKHLDEIDENLQKEVKKVRKNIDKKLKSFSLEDFEEQIEKVEFLTGEMMAVCSQDREEVEI